jgi:EAL domain-containing protein (putative c-di-GMP-specific phosphodiesterase class I)/FixJ family two-component response regulator
MVNQLTSDYLENGVLVVDDELFVLQLTEAMLRNIGFQRIFSVSSVAEAIDLLTRTTFIGLIISDLNMPGCDGMDLFERIEQLGFKGDLLLMSAEDEQTLKMSERLAKKRHLTVLGALQKPFSVKQLKDALLRHTGSVRQSHKPNVQPRKIPPSILKLAIQKGNIEPWFQPKIDIHSRQAVGFEALARWESIEFGNVSPVEFIPLAEQNGLIDDLTLLMVAKVASVLQQLQLEGIEMGTAINLSMDSLRNTEFSRRLFATMEEHAVPYSRIKFEVTESRLMDDFVRPLEVLLRLRMRKIRLSIDDFGTGHSNLGQLRDLPFDELKLDRSYTHVSSEMKRTSVILESTINMAHQLNMTVVAEGIETLDDWYRLKSLGCDQVQGFLLARPMPAIEIPAWLAHWPKQAEKLFLS